MVDKDLLYGEECYAIQGAVFEVYREQGCGFLEAVYQECLERELAARGIPFEARKEMQISYKGLPLARTYKADLICYGKILVELKAVSETNKEYHAQVLDYLKATGFRLGLLVNFGHYPKATIERIIFFAHFVPLVYFAVKIFFS